MALDSTNFLKNILGRFCKKTNDSAVKSIYMGYESLIENWKSARPEYKNFCYDGPLFDELWANSSKIMFLLKECHEDWYEFRGYEHGPQGNSNLFWRNIRIWTYIIDEITNNRKPSYNEALKIKEEPNKSIAYVNLKKNAEKKGNSSDFDICEYVKKDKDFLLQQIDFIKPNIVLCCGTFKFCNLLYNKIDKISDRLHLGDNMYFIDFWHPSYQYSSFQNNYEELIKNVEKIKIS